MIELNQPLIVYTAIAFAFLVFALAKFGFGPIVSMLDEREKKIRESIEQAEHARLESERLLRDYEEKLAEARAEAHKIIAEGKQLGENLRAEIKTKADEEVKLMIAKAEDQINRDVEQAIKELRTEVGDLSVTLAAKVIEKELDKAAHEQLIENYLSEVGRLS
ncbi:MAG: ATP synthase F0 subunit B [Candidatus Aquicultor primus]|jgi:F-type H+-transporting ATPase subunit b|uniref:ATP synthase subunit b n=1 Tax=Candidatus Aquicultor primus TaxID=1797195 RepID=A0A1F2UFN9_9ACTN|nr:MAG: ATP synthase F0 subunit B [Candidatus Aquicultor primus]HCG98634.1 ATP synthase F0 subunit B [Actinomycetota bacterium]